MRDSSIVIALGMRAGRRGAGEGFDFDLTKDDKSSL